MNLQHGKKHPWLLTTNQTFQVFAILFSWNAILLIVLVYGASKNEVALESMARAVEIERLEQAEKAKKAEPPSPKVVAPPNTIPDARTSNLRISMPQGWRWRGCQVTETGDSVEILLGQ